LYYNLTFYSFYNKNLISIQPFAHLYISNGICSHVRGNSTEGINLSTDTYLREDIYLLTINPKTEKIIFAINAPVTGSEAAPTLYQITFQIQQLQYLPTSLDLQTGEQSSLSYNPY
jgi:hypothetical protein